MEFRWDSLEFGKEEEAIRKYEIDYDSFPKELFEFTENKSKKTKKVDKDGWITIESNTKDEEILKNIGLLPK